MTPQEIAECRRIYRRRLKRGFHFNPPKGVAPSVEVLGWYEECADRMKQWGENNQPPIR